MSRILFFMDLLIEIDGRYVFCPQTGTILPCTLGPHASLDSQAKKRSPPFFDVDVHTCTLEVHVLLSIVPSTDVCISMCVSVYLVYHVYLCISLAGTAEAAAPIGGSPSAPCAAIAVSFGRFLGFLSVSGMTRAVQSLSLIHI